MPRTQSYRRRLSRAAAPAAFLCLISYFGYHAVHGDHGLLALRDLNARAQAMEHQAAALADRRRQLETKVALLRPDNLDPDMLDERARRTLGFVHPDEIVILRPKRLLATH